MYRITRRSPRLALLLLSVWLPAAVAHADCPSAGLTPISALVGIDRGAVPQGRIEVRGIVTGDFRGEDRLRGFFLQSTGPAADGLPAGIFVFTPDHRAESSPLAPGIEVVVSAQASKFRGQPQLSRISKIRVCDEPGVPAPVALPFPPATASALTRYQGLHVRLEGPVTVTGNGDLARFGSLTLSSGGRLFRPTNAAETRAADHALRRLILDDGSYQTHPEPTPWLDADGTRRVGSVVDAASGILVHAFDDWRLHPLDADAVRFGAGNLRPDPPPRGHGPRIVGFNVENYFLSLGQRGAATRQDLSRQQQQLKAVAAGLEADLIGLIEVENRPKVGADLVRLLGEARGIPGGYRHFELRQPVGRDVIRVMLAWDPARVALIDGPFIDDDPVHHRPPLAGHFRTAAEGPGKLVVVIHHKAKSGCPASGDIDRGQGCWNERRVAQSEALVRFIADLRRQTGTDRVLIIGDINSYGDEDPVTVMRKAGYIDLIADRLRPEARYSYVFRDESGYLDSALATKELAGDVARIGFWHVNADEPPFLRGRGGRGGPWRSSDHDPVVLDLRRDLN